MKHKKTRHIAICSTSFYEYDRRLQRIAYALIEGGYQISWLSRQKHTDSQPISGIKHHIIKTSAVSGPRFYFQFNKELDKKLREIKPDVINAIDLDTLIGCHKSATKMKASLTFDAHEIYYEVPELIGRPIKKGIWKTVARRYLPRIKNAYTVNDSLREHYQSRYGGTYEVVRNVPELKDSLISERNTKSLVYLGVLNAGRGLEIAINAMSQLPDYDLHLIGEGDLYEPLKAQASDTTNITFHGYQKPDQIKTLLSSMGIGLNMLQAESLNYKLSLANKFFDYMHSGLPSINMNYPEYQKIINVNKVGLLVNEYSVNNLIKAIRQLESKATYDLIKSNAIAAREKYCWENEKQKLLKLYSRVEIKLT